MASSQTPAREQVLVSSRKACQSPPQVIFIFTIQKTGNQMANADTKLKQLLADVFGEDPQSITDESSIDTIDQWTSLRHLNLVVALEELFNIQLNEEETLEIISVALIKAVLADHGIVFAEANP